MAQAWRRGYPGHPFLHPRESHSSVTPRFSLTHTRCTKAFATRSRHGPCVEAGIHRAHPSYTPEDGSGVEAQVTPAHPLVYPRESQPVSDSGLRTRCCTYSRPPIRCYTCSPRPAYTRRRRADRPALCAWSSSLPAIGPRLLRDPARPPWALSPHGRPQPSAAEPFRR
jgi:hypothetical protein